jgi:hypothetical protein
MIAMANIRRRGFIPPVFHFDLAAQDEDIKCMDMTARKALRIF